MGTRGRGSVAILGGGMAALTAAFELSKGDWTSRFERITVYQRGWRLGGKGASGRGPHGRIEEHGLHVLLGYYEQTFELMRRCYDELDRPSSDPACPIQTWDDAISPCSDVGVWDGEGGRPEPWVAQFRSGPTLTSESRPSAWPIGGPELVVRSLGLLADFFDSLPNNGSRSSGGGYLTASPSPAPSWRDAPVSGGLATALRGTALLGLAAPLSLVHRLPAVAAPLLAALDGAVAADPAARRTWELIELVAANLVGVASDGLLGGDEGFAAIDDLDYREWLLRHRIDKRALDSPLLNGMYDLVFGYENGDRARPRFSAGLGLQLATRMLLGYSGALFWKMRAGMGDIVFAPLFQVLARRGVEIRFFHRVDALHLSEDGRRIAAIDVAVQADAEDSAGGYQPLVRVKGLPCWPSSPLTRQLRHPEATDGIDLEAHAARHRDTRQLTLRDGTDFDHVVFGISLGMVRHVCAELVSRSPSWKAMVEGVGTVATQSLQLWMKDDEAALGWGGPAGVVLSGFRGRFDTWASMPQVLSAEDWPEAEQPRSAAYFCGAREPGSPAVAEVVRSFLDREVATLWPKAANESGFRTNLLADGSIDKQYWRANEDPSDLYVQSLPGTGRFRIKPGCTGFENLAVCGDWTDCGLNAGCVEAAVLSGQLAAQAVSEHVHDRDSRDG